MDIARMGRLKDSELGTGDKLCLELDGGDIVPLLQNGYTMSRFMGLKHGVQTKGWQPEDKVHIALQHQLTPKEENVGTACRLHLDPGGDLYYTIFNDAALHRAPTCIELPLPNDSVDDAYGTLARLGIVAVRFLYLDALAGAIRHPEQWL